MGKRNDGINCISYLIADGELLAQDEEMRRIQARLDFLTKTVSSCWDFLRETEEIISPELRREMKHIEDELEHIRNHLKSGIRNGAFEWVDSILVKVNLTYITHGYFHLNLTILTLP